ncbi:hypothetical protein XELAEV_18021251mg [Xenopus laevis]|uniref:Uncharacterized protein n=1 Tax=Xenopus laevis TaxID=8355 RepID=A0A974DAZ2_XENLA|nr:hypothetical protein XELAEV_18021251mg [Xenopus laevis]
MPVEKLSCFLTSGKMGKTVQFKEIHSPNVREYQKISVNRFRLNHCRLKRQLEKFLTPADLYLNNLKSPKENKRTYTGNRNVRQIKDSKKKCRGDQRETDKGPRALLKEEDHNRKAMESELKKKNDSIVDFKKLLKEATERELRQ